ncbi:hypothetical protein [Nigerium massiliense]|uniref:hypothetical protein n=1 Tax=Nigerium massiliense TaxID=1522317 RepID=UPI0009079C5F|nr:hypothetical protein [Nigerium massiliense]
MTTTYRIKARPAVRAYALAAVLAIVGALLIVLANLNAWSVAVTVIGVVLLVLGVALVGLGYVAGKRMQVSLALDERGYSIRDRSGQREGTWAGITRVTQGPGRLTFHGTDDNGFVLYDPSGDAELLNRLAADVAEHLDHDRGYTKVPGGETSPGAD